MDKKNVAFLNIYQNKVNRGAETFVKEVSLRLSKKYTVDVISDVNYLHLLKARYDVIIPTNGRLQAVFTRIVAWLSGAKVVISGQSGVGLDDRVNLYTFPNAFVALSQEASSWAKKKNPFVKVSKIPNGVDLKKFKVIDAKAVSGQKVVLSVGAFTKEKRHDLTIKAVSNLTGVKLVIVGWGGEKKEEIIELGKTLLGRNFEVVSAANEKMPGFYRKADVLAFPTVPWESFGIAMVEAMASGLPVVAADDPIRREIVGEAGAFVDPADTEAYAGALKKALATNWGDKPRMQAEKFSWDKIAKEYEDLFNKLIK